MTTSLHRYATSLAAAILLFLASEARAQGVADAALATSGGTRYVVAFPDTTMNTFDPRYPPRAYADKAFLLIYSAVDARISITGTGYDNTLQKSGGTFTSVDLMGGSGASAPLPIVTQRCKAATNTFRIESDVPVIVYQYLVTKFGTEAWSPLPVEAWGTEYYAAAMPGEVGADLSPGGEFDYRRKNKMFPAEILVIAAFDDTRISITPNGMVLDSCAIDDVVLQAGEAYQIQSYVDTLTANVGTPQPDFAGSRIVSTKPVAVLSGNTRAMLVDETIGLGKNIFKNMQIEALSPVELHGTSFVYMPTWDSRRPTGAPNEDPSEKRTAEFVRVYGSSEEPTLGYFMQGGVPVPFDSAIVQGGSVRVRHTPNLARAYVTTTPAQVMMHSAAVVRYGGTTQGFGGYIGAAYDGWGGYMVELTPREQWVRFAPYYASTHPGGMEHSINVVTDTAHKDDVYLRNGSRFIFNRPIQGTDLIWGSMSLNPGIDHHLEGRNGATFAGYVYGTLVKGGHEEYRPGSARRAEDPPQSANGGDDDDAEILHPSEFEEYLAISYGYPLVGARRLIGRSDSLRIETSSDCAGTCISVESLNDSATGLRAVNLDAAVNARVVSIVPTPLSGATTATICVGPINQAVDASATIVIIDRTGTMTRVPFEYRTQRLDADSSRVSFGAMSAGQRAIRRVVFTNAQSHPITVDTVQLAGGAQGFRVQQPTSFPVTIQPSERLVVELEAAPAEIDRGYHDTLVVVMPCASHRIPLVAETNQPCVTVNDIDFGALQPGASRTRVLRIANEGSDVVTFTSPLITWVDSRFAIDAADLARLGAASLARGEYIDIPVTYTASVVGTFVDSARVWASTRECDDITTWRVVVDAGAAAPGESSIGMSLGAANPNPVSGTVELRFGLARPVHATIVLYDERGTRVATLLDGTPGAGEHVVRYDATSLPAGIYFYRLSAGGVEQTRTFVRR